MKKLILLFSLLILLGAGCQKPMGTGDTILENQILETIATAQAQYLKDNGRYFALVPTSKKPPSLLETPDNLNDKSHWMNKKTPELVSLPSKLPFSVTVWETQNPKPAYQVVFQKIIKVPKVRTNTTTTLQESYNEEQLWVKAVGNGNFKSWDWIYE